MCAVLTSSVTGHAAVCNARFTRFAGDESVTEEEGAISMKWFWRNFDIAGEVRQERERSHQTRCCARACYQL
jgi:hypothetical protein